MARGSLGSLTIDLAANITRFEQSLTRAEHLATARSRAIKTTFIALGSGVAAALGGIGFQKIIDESLAFGKTLEDTSQKLGLTAEFLQELRFAADQTGVPVQALDVGIQRFTRRLGEAAEGGGVLFNVMNELGIELRRNDGTMKSTEEVLNEYADAIQNADSSQKQLLLAFKAFDTEGAALVNTLRNGKKGLDDLREAGRAAGGILSGTLTESAKQIDDRWSTLTDTIGNKFKASVISAIDSALNLFNVFNNLADVQGRLIVVQDKILETEIRVENARGRNRKAAKERLTDLEAERMELERLQETLINARNARDLMTTGLNAGSTTSTTDTHKNTFTGMTAEEMQADYDMAVSMGEQFLEIYYRQNEQRLRSEQQINALVTASKFNALQNAVGFLQELGTKSKAAALAALILQKGLAVGQTIINTEVAAMRALAELGPIAGPPAAASIKAMGAASIGLIAATGLLQASGISSGGGAYGSGTVASPTMTSDVNQFQPSQQQGTQGTITINVSGVVTEEIIQDLMIPAIQDAVNDKDVILIRSDSRQALELTA